MKTPIELAEEHAEFLFPNSIQQIEFSKTGADMNEASQRSFIAGYEAAQPKWIPIEEYESGKIIRWHKIYKCCIEVSPISDFPALRVPINCKWITAQRDNTWPEEAFEPFFMLPLPSPPKTTDNDNP